MTRRGDDSAWNEFVVWCRKRGLNPMPANPWTVAAYARWCERQHRFPAIMKTIRAIARVHRSKSRRRPERHPTVARTMRMIETRARARSKKNKKASGLFPEADIMGQPTKSGPARKTARKTARKAAAGGKGGTRSAAKAAPRRGLSAGPKLVPRRSLKK